MADSQQRGYPWDNFRSTVDKGMNLNSVRRRVGRKKTQTLSCTKNYGSTRSKSGGLLIFVCPHGFVWGYSNVGYAESTTGVLDLVENFSAVAPKVLIYDFACGLHKTAKNPSNGFFQGTHFILDEVHSVSHTCNYSYRLANYLSQYEDADMRTLATSLPEILNSQLRQLAPSVAYSSQSLSWVLTSTFLYFINSQRAARIMQEKERTDRLWELIPGDNRQDSDTTECETSDDQDTDSAQEQ